MANEPAGIKVEPTPGPWEARHVSDDFDSQHVILMGEARETYPDVYWHHEVLVYDHGFEPGDEGWAEVEANARVIAAAPEMLAVLRKVDEQGTAAYPSGPDDPFVESDLTPEALDMWKAVRAVIALATDGDR